MSAPAVLMHDSEAPAVVQRSSPYLQWLTENFDRLDEECLAAPCEDKGAWLRQQYTIETGKTP